MFFALTFVFLLGLQNICNAQLSATPDIDGAINVSWGGGTEDVYRDTSPLSGRAVADIPDLLLSSSVTSLTDSNTTDGTMYYYGGR